MSSRFGYRPALDGIRGIAVLAVMAFHTGLPWVPGGFLGVDAFFVLSGFLITALLLAEHKRNGAISLRQFYLRRALRLLPVLFVLLLVLFAYSLSFPLHEASVRLWKQILFTLFYIANWALAYGAMPAMAMLGHTWSLAIEEQFYLSWPLLVVAFLHFRERLGGLVGLTLVAIVAIATHRFFLIDGAGSLDRAFFGFDTRADALLVGCLTALCGAAGLLPTSLRARNAQRVAALVAALVLAVLAAKASSVSLYLFRGGFTLVALGVATVIVEVMAAPDGLLARVLTWSPLVRIGRISYGLYLWHWPVYLVLRPVRLGWSPEATALLRVAVSLAIAALSFAIVERPFLRWKEHIATG